ncbi:MAG: hypothetical protein KIS79_04935 [Burkholderiales bacterium]|nr:hypothetical protein [Burkholderiales bacterium]
MAGVTIGLRQRNRYPGTPIDAPAEPAIHWHSTESIPPLLLRQPTMGELHSALRRCPPGLRPDPRRRHADRAHRQLDVQRFTNRFDELEVGIVDRKARI